MQLFPFELILHAAHTCAGQFLNVLNTGAVLGEQLSDGKCNTILGSNAEKQTVHDS